MPFKVKELMIHILPEEGVGGTCGLITQIAPGCGCTFQTDMWTTRLTGLIGARWWTTIGPDLVPGPLGSGNLTTLKQQLQEQLAQIEALEKVAEERLRPKTLSEVETLIKKLQEALAELEAHKNELQQKTQTGQAT
jgi:hypothetical protein